MQIKKEEMKSEIIKSAKNEFLEKGFQGASVRGIVKNAKTTIGNFYNYFDGKEDVFCAVVEPTHKVITRFIQTHSAEDEDSSLFEKLDAKNARKAVADALSLFSDSFIEDLILLAECSKGTRYETFIDILTSYISRHFAEHKNIINPRYEDNGISSLLSRQFVDGVLSVLKKDSPASYKIDLIAEYLLFFAYGMYGLLKK